MENLEKISKIRYEQVLSRSFKNDMELFLYENIFSEKLGTDALKESYKIFTGTEQLQESYLSARRLSKDELTIEYKGKTLSVKEIDLAYNDWYKDKRSIEEYKKLFRIHRFIKYEAFISFYKNGGKERSCIYCLITEEKIDQLIKSNRIKTKRLLIRGRSLEVDKKNPNGKYEEGNMVFCCYWCNNAKTDEFTFDEFGPIGDVIKEIWKKRS